MHQEPDSREIEAAFSEAYKEWIAIPENARAVEMRRLERFAAEYSNFDTRYSKNPKKRGEIKRSLKKLRSPLLHGSNPDWKKLADRLFPHDSPLIYIGNGFWYEKDIDHYGSEARIKYQQNRKAPRVIVMENVDTDDGLLFVGMGNRNGFSFISGRGKGTSGSWAHRTDIPLEEVVQMCAQQYSDFHYSLPWNLKWLRKDFGLDEVPWARIYFVGKGRGDDTKRTAELDLPALKSYHIHPLEGEKLHSIEFGGNHVSLSLGSGAGYYGLVSGYSEWETPKVSMFARPPFSEHPLVSKFMADIMNSVSIFAQKDKQHAQPAFKQLAYTPRGLLTL